METLTGWLSAPDLWAARLILQRGLGLLYLVAFLNVVNQWVPLLGEQGLLPTPRHLARAEPREAPSLFHRAYSDRLAVGLGRVGVALSALVVVGVVERLPAPLVMGVWAALWALYLSYVNIGQIFYAFGWESLLLEAGFLAIWLGPRDTAPPLLVLWLFRWLLFRVEFGAGLIKIRGDRCWRDLTCLRFHHETQPIPGPLSWWFHHLPMPLHRVEVAANHVTQLVVPFLLFAPQPVASVAAAIVVTTQGWLVVSGNFAWLNATTMVIAAAALSGEVLGWVVPDAWVTPPDDLAALPAWHAIASIALAALVTWLSVPVVRNLVSRKQRMNASFTSLRLVNTYGAFGSISKERYEVVIEGTLARDPRDPEAEWREYQFRGKPGEPGRRPPQVAPYHLRIDWLLWFVPLSSAYRGTWFRALLEHLASGDPLVRRLVRVDPFDGEAPAWVRARRFRYRYTTRAERRETGDWWVRSSAGEFAGPVRGAALDAGP